MIPHAPSGRMKLTHVQVTHMRILIRFPLAWAAATSFKGREKKAWEQQQKRDMGLRVSGHFRSSPSLVANVE